MKDILNIAIVGYGNIAKTHALAMSAANIRYDLPFRMDLSHIITARKDSVSFPGAVICGSIEEAMAIADIDIIDICSVNSAHLSAIESAAQYGKAIYCEKPLAGTAAEAARAVALAEENGVATGVPLIFRYLPCVRLLKREIENKTLGPVIEFQAAYDHKGYLSPAKRKGWRTGADAGGGALLDLGIHMLDTIRVIFGEVKSIAHRKHIYFKDVATDETCYSTLETERGVRGSMSCSRIFAQRRQKTEITVYCENGSFRCDFSNPYELEVNPFDSGTAYLRPQPGDDCLCYFASEALALNYHMDAHIACLTDFARKVYDRSDSGFGADFKQAYLSQLLTE